VRTTKKDQDSCRHLHPQQVNRLFKRWCKETGIPFTQFSSHSMRTTAATRALKSGAPVENVRYMLGHADIRTTLLYDKRQQSPENAASFLTNYDGE
jgi:integrase